MKKRPCAWDSMHFGMHVTVFSETKKWWKDLASESSIPRSPFDADEMHRWTELSIGDAGSTP